MSAFRHQVAHRLRIRDERNTGTAARGKGTRVPRRDAQMMIALYVTHLMTHAQIAQKLGWSEPAVRRILEENGVKARSSQRLAKIKAIAKRMRTQGRLPTEPVAS